MIHMYESLNESETGNLIEAIEWMNVDLEEPNTTWLEPYGE